MKNKIWEIIFGVVLLVGIIVCTMCDIAISGAFTWSLVPISSIIFGWVALFPIIKLGKKGIIPSFIVLSICISLYLYVLSTIIKDNNLILSIGSRMSIISIIYLVCIFGIFKIFKKRKYGAISLSFLIGIPICGIINYYLSEMFRQPLFDIWDILSMLTLLILSVIFFILSLRSEKRKN